jgi:hypothetical protein
VRICDPHLYYFLTVVGSNGSGYGCGAAPEYLIDRSFVYSPDVASVYSYSRLSLFDV